MFVCFELEKPSFLKLDHVLIKHCLKNKRFKVNHDISSDNILQLMQQS